MRRILKSGFSVALAAVLVAVCVFSFTGCGGSKASEKAVSVGKQALTVADNYLDGSISNDEARSKIEELLAELDYVDGMDRTDEHYAEDFAIRVDVTCLSTSILHDSDVFGDDSSYESVVEDRNNLAKDIGEKSR